MLQDFILSNGVLSLGGITFPYAAKSSAYLTDEDYFIDCTSGTFTVTLPTAVGRAGQIYVIKNSGTGVITVDTTSAQTIDGASTKSLIQYISIVVESTGSNWAISGATGSQGNQGLKGDQGNQGNQGSVGAQGFQGFQGLKGDQGNQGNQGLTGPVAGSANQVVYKDGSNAAAGSSAFTFDGTSVTVPILSVTRTAGTGTQNPSVTVTAPAHTALTASTESNDLNINLARTVQFAAGTINTQRAVRIQAPTYSFVSASSISTAATVQIDSAPVSGTNATISFPVALCIKTGISAGTGILIESAIGQTGDLIRFRTWGGVITSRITARGMLHYTPDTGDQVPSLRIDAPSQTALAASTEYNDIYFYLARTLQFSTGNITTQRAFRIDAPTYSAVGASTITTAVTMQVDSAPVAGTNVTLTNAIAFRVLTGTTTGVGLVVQGAASQTADLLRIQNNSAANLLSVNSNGSLSLSPYGTSAGNTNEIRFLELAANGSNYVGFKGGDNITSNVIWTLPAADGTNGQVLSTNASGTLSWTSNVIFATSAANIIGGSFGQMLYTTWEGSTGFLPTGTKGQVLTSNGTAAPSWSNAPSAASNIFLANNFGGL